MSCKKFRNNITYIDVFGEKPSLTYKRRRTYQTTYGAFFTMIMIIFVSAIGIN